MPTAEPLDPAAAATVTGTTAPADIVADVQYHTERLRLSPPSAVDDHQLQQHSWRQLPQCDSVSAGGGAAADQLLYGRVQKRHQSSGGGSGGSDIGATTATNGHRSPLILDHSTADDSAKHQLSHPQHPYRQQQQQRMVREEQTSRVTQVYSRTQRMVPVINGTHPHHSHSHPHHHHHSLHHDHHQHQHQQHSPSSDGHNASHSPLLDNSRGGRGGVGTVAPASGYAELDSTLVPPHLASSASSVVPPDAEHDDGDYESHYAPVSRHHQLQLHRDHVHYHTRPQQQQQLSPSLAGHHAAPRAVFDEVLRDVVHEQDVADAGGRGGGAGGHEPIQFRNPDLHEVISFLGHANNVVKANAAAYLQHLCYMDDPMKQKTRALGGIPPLVQLLAHPIPEVQRNACGALRNLCYGRQNDENKRAICHAAGVPALVRLLRKTPENEIKELATGILWNLSSCEHLKRSIIDDGLAVLVNHTIIPQSGWNRSCAGGGGGGALTTLFRNSTGVLRNVSSAGEHARRSLRECDGLVEALLLVVRAAVGNANIDNKCVENCVCVLRNLSYRCQEVDDPDYDKHPPATSASAATSSATLQHNRPGSSAVPAAAGPGCFGSRRQRDGSVSQSGPGGAAAGAAAGATEPADHVRGMHLLWQPDIVPMYLKLLSDCSNPETLEAAAGALQNLAACFWPPSVHIRAAVRKEKGLPVLVELLRMDVDRVVCAVATALRNLAIDQRNKELIGKYAMRDLVQKLPGGGGGSSCVCSDDTVAAVLATLNEVIRRSAEFCRSLLELDGVAPLLAISRQRGHNARVVRFAGQLLGSMWSHHELRDAYRKAGYRESDFVPRAAGVAGGGGGGGGGGGVGTGSGETHSLSVNSTLNRPMASQGSTRYEDRTIARDAGLTRLPPSSEPLYAQVNRDRKRLPNQQPLHPQQQQQQYEATGVWALPGDEAVCDSWV